MNSFTLLLLILSQADSNLDAMVTTLVKFPMGLCSRLFHLVGVVLGDFPAAVVAMANRPGVEKSRHSMTTPMRLTSVSTKARSWKKKTNNYLYVCSRLPLAGVHHHFWFLLQVSGWMSKDTSRMKLSSQTTASLKFTIQIKCSLDYFNPLSDSTPFAQKFKDLQGTKSNMF